MSANSRIKINKITLKDDEVPAKVKVLLCPFESHTDFSAENIELFQNEAKIIEKQIRENEFSLNVVLEMDSYMEIHLYSKSNKDQEFQYLGKCVINRYKSDFGRASKPAIGDLFSVDFEIESLEDLVWKEEPSGQFIFKIHKITCYETQDFVGEDEIELKIKYDGRSRKFPEHHKWYNFKKGQTRNFYKSENPIEIIFRNSVVVKVKEIDVLYDDDLGTYTASTEPGKDKVIRVQSKGGDYSILYDVEVVYGSVQVNKEKLSFPLTENLSSPNFEEIENKKNRIYDLLEENLKSRMLLMNYSIEPMVFNLQLIQGLNPSQSSNNNEVDNFIDEYYEEFLENDEMRQKFIESLTHSQTPLMAYPIFPEPAYYYLKELNEKFILPAAEAMPNDTMAMVVNNPAFIEAFLCGMNTEMGKELLWREYPTDSRGSYFRKFWDTELKSDIREEVQKDSFFDILPIHQWDKRENSDSNHHLGENHYPGKEDLLIFVIKGELLKKYPETTIFLGASELKNNKIKLNPKGDKIYPELSAWLSDDIFMVGFAEKLKFLVGNPKENKAGYFLCFMNKPGETRFGNVSETQNAKHSADYAGQILIEPYIYAKHISQFLSGWKIKNKKV